MQATEINRGIPVEQDFLLPFALSLTRDMEDAKDLIQETFYRAFSNADKFSFGSNFKAWMFTIMRNVFINNYRRKSREHSLIEKYPADSFPQHPQLAVANLNLSSLSVKEIHYQLHHLPEIFKAPLIMHIDGYKYQEIADALGEPIGTIKSRIFLARKLMKEKLPGYTTI